MTTPPTEVTAPPELTRAQVRDRIAQAAAARDEGMAWAEMAEDARRGWSRDLIDQAIGWMAATGSRFSANDLRDLLPPDTPVRGLMGARFRIASLGGVIRRVDSVTSTKPNTHTKPVDVWVGTQVDDLDPIEAIA